MRITGLAFGVSGVEVALDGSIRSVSGVCRTCGKAGSALRPTAISGLLDGECPEHSADRA